MAKSKRQGRPSSYSENVANIVCDRLSAGESLVAICSAADMPATSTVFKWLSERVDFSERYARAREAQADFLAQEILQIANTPQVGVTKTEKVTGVEIKTADMIEHRRLQVDARKWLASKLAPKKYGDRLTQEVTGKDGGPVQTEATVIILPSNGRDIATKG